MFELLKHHNIVFNVMHHVFFLLSLLLLIIISGLIVNYLSLQLNVSSEKTASCGFKLAVSFYLLNKTDPNVRSIINLVYQNYIFKYCLT